MSQQVIYIEKDDPNDPCVSVKAIGTPSLRLTLQEAIELLKKQPRCLFTYVNGKKVFLTVATSRFGNEYVKTENDGEEENILLKLPGCPS